MFGIIGLFLFILYQGYKFVNAIKLGLKKADRDPRFRGLVYKDLNDRYRLYENDKTCEVYRDENRDLIIGYIGKVYYNLSEMDRQEEAERAKARGEKIIPYSNGHVRHTFNMMLHEHIEREDFAEGARFKNLETGAVYVIRKFEDHLYYLDIRTKEIIGWTDGEKKRKEIVFKYSDQCKPAKKYADSYKMSEQEYVDKINNDTKNRKYDHLYNSYEYSCDSDYSEERLAKLEDDLQEEAVKQYELDNWFNHGLIPD